MEHDTQATRDEALSFLVNHDVGVLATASNDGQPSSRMVYYTCDDSFNVYFITLKNTRKVAQIKINPKVAFVVSETGTPHTIQIEGEAQDMSATATNDALVTDFIKRLASHKQFGIPLTHLDASELVFYKISPTWIRWGDFTFGTGTDTVLTQLAVEPE
ncbi:MAG TPA: pyridoxamine 5'-phosphate oxidase family protein [Candidatus Paceibacterota bacterium]|nr:pyridoxamine 5'-phosphate oxidase family protein [Candidatus Paceibacterota bacterium]